MTGDQTTSNNPDTADLTYWLALLHTPGIGPVACGKLLDQYSTPRTIFSAAEQHDPLLEKFLKPDSLAALRQPDWRQIDEGLAWLEDSQHHALTWHDHRYPRLLKETRYPPPVLFVSGNVNILSSVQLAIVGSRNPSPSGTQISEDFARSLSISGLTITSGLALGVDGAAHRGAMAGSGRTVAVLGCGPDRVYPHRHVPLAAEITRHGALVTEFPPGTAPLPSHFPRRNRIISGLSVGTLVTEAALRSGSLITARLAAEQGREVFAVPGSIHNPLARGCHALLRDGAKLVEQLNDILEEIAPLCHAALTDEEISHKHYGYNLALDQRQQKVINTLGFDPMSMDTLSSQTGMTTAELAPVLLSLELAGQIASLPGGRIVRLGCKEPI